MRTSISRYALPLLAGFLALSLAGPIQAFQDGGTNSQTPSSKLLEIDGGYIWVMAGEGILDGVHTTLDSYKRPDGERIDTITARIGSVDGVAAKAFHQHFDHSAAEIVKQEDILDGSGKVIGYRSVLTLVDKDHKKSTAIVITKGADFREYVSSSARDALAFEEYTNSLPAQHAKQ
jgi:hypothetical protein